MKKVFERLIVFLSVLLTLAVLSSCVTRSMESTSDMEAPEPSPALISTGETAAMDPEQASTPAYFRASKGDFHLAILGTIHLGLPEFYPLPEGIELDFQDRGALVLEVNLLEYDEASLVSLGLNYMLSADPQALPGLLGEETFVQLVEYMAGYGLPEAYVMALEPWALEQTIAGLQITESGYLADFGTEGYLLSRINPEEDVWVLGLESLEEQFQLFKGQDIDYQVASLKRTLDSVEQTASEVEALMDAWRWGDLESILEITEMDLDLIPGDEEAMDILLGQRNRNWASTISETWATNPEIVHARSGSSPDLFIAVGSAHLVGPDSLPELLREAGFQLERIQF